MEDFVPLPLTPSIPPEPKPRHTLTIVLLIAIVLLCGASLFLLKYIGVDKSKTLANTPATKQTVTLAASASSSTVLQVEPKAIIHVPLPDEVRGIYWTAETAGSKRADELLDYAVTSHLNTMVIDLKMDNGELGFAPNDPALKENTPKKPYIKDLDGLLNRLAEKNMYRIARIFIFRDGAFGKLHPELELRYAGGSVWRDNTGTPWLDPAAPEVADYAIALAREAYARGFDEVQYDYVRFPSDGSLSAIRYPVYDGKTTKAKAMRAFFQKVGGTLQAEHIPVSFDLFGLTFINTDDLGIGQRLADVFPFTDFASPMAYPSHYASGFQGYVNPALYPYQVVKYTLDRGLPTLKREDPVLNLDDATSTRKKFRPWIQSFNMGATYDAAKIEAQIKASRDAGASGWMLWNARNIYTTMDYK